MVMFLDEPTTGLDSSSCTKIVNLLKRLAQEGKTIICTIHQPSASLFELFDQVYVLAKGSCLYQGATNKLVPYLEDMQMPCPMYHNPADYIIELACGDHGEDKIDILKTGSQNGSKNFQSFDNPEAPRDDESLTVPMQIAILLKEHFNRWYSLKAFYMAMTLIDMPISILCCTLFSVIVYGMSAQPLEIIRFFMFFIISLLIMFIGQSTGFMIGAVFNVVNGTFIGPTLAVALMMFSGFGILLRDLPSYLKWGSYVSYLRYGLEG
ncbi:ATP-binding cassette sub-family G member [Ooceraea biroi]|uniref:ATP-binding cassette sub-family G member n=1 Tax=Ooceraea biroi TaxID=2015173 RepID=A0A026VXI2_OOCBI|nr:ATP-binding cassette sub-family G member [Ooceraea biroi]